MNELLRDLVHQNTWANVQLVEFCMRLDDDKVGFSADGVYSTPAETLLHVVAAEQRYLRGLTGEQVEPSVSERRWPGFEDLLAAARANGKAFDRIATGLQGNRVVKNSYQGEDFETDLSVYLVQTLNHGTEHRSQVKVVLSIAGVVPPELDGWSWALANGKSRKVGT